MSHSRPSLPFTQPAVRWPPRNVGWALQRERRDRFLSGGVERRSPVGSRPPWPRRDLKKAKRADSYSNDGESGAKRGSSPYGIATSTLLDAITSVLGTPANHRPESGSRKASDFDPRD
jgi:hypothetical protein